MLTYKYRKNFHILALTILSWGLFSFFVGKTAYSKPSLVLVFTVGASLLSVWILHLLDYFNSERVLPRHSDLLLILCAFPLAGGLQSGIIYSFSHYLRIPLIKIWMMSPVVALGVFGAKYAIDWLLLLRGRKKKIVLDLLPIERAELIDEFRCLRLDRYFQFLDASEMKETFLQKREAEIDQIIISRAATREFKDDAYLLRAHLAGIPIVDRRKVSADLAGRLNLNDSDSWSFILTATRQTALLCAYSRFKAFFEPLLALLLGLTLSPIIGLLAFALHFGGKGPIFTRRSRLGYLGKSFEILSFNTNLLQTPLRLAKFLRVTHFEHLPQIWNVVCGQMSFFGPKAEAPEYYALLKQSVPQTTMRTTVRPGITGWAQVRAPRFASPPSIDDLRDVMEFDLYYIQHVSLRIDLIILVRTLILMVIGKATVLRAQSTTEDSILGRLAAGQSK